jgi:sulfonate transport system permease protein
VTLTTTTAATPAPGSGAQNLAPDSADTTRLSPPTRRRRKALPAGLQAALTVVLPIGLLAWWAIGTATGAIPSKILPSPAAVLEALSRLAVDGAIYGHIGASLLRAFLGLVIGGMLGFILGTTTALSRIGERLLDPTVQAIRTIPPLALLSLFILWFGLGEEPKITLIALGAAFPIYINTVSGIRSVDKKLVEAAETFNVSLAGRIFGIILPQALPAIFSGIRLATSISIMLLVAAEQIATNGLGFLLLQGQSYFDSAQVIVVILIYALLGVIADLIVRLIQRASTPWTAKGAQR